MGGAEEIFVSIHIVLGMLGFFAPKMDCPAAFAEICIYKNAYHSHLDFAERVRIIYCLQKIFVYKIHCDIFV